MWRGSCRMRSWGKCCARSRSDARKDRPARKRLPAHSRKTWVMVIQEGGRASMIDTVVLDIDGTLVDTNYHHVIAWDRAFRRHEVAVPLWRVHRAIGMGGDRL